MKYKIGDVVIITTPSGDRRYCVHSVMEHDYRYEVFHENGGVIFLILEDLIKCKAPITTFSPYKSIKPFLLKDVD